jgi:hypothetical protein
MSMAFLCAPARMSLAHPCSRFIILILERLLTAPLHLTLKSGCLKTLIIRFDLVSRRFISGFFLGLMRLGAVPMMLGSLGAPICGRWLNREGLAV